MKMFAMPTVQIPLRCEYSIMYVCMYVCMNGNSQGIPSPMTRRIHSSKSFGGPFATAFATLASIIVMVYVYNAVCIYIYMYVCMYA